MKRTESPGVAGTRETAEGCPSAACARQGLSLCCAFGSMCRMARAGERLTPDVKSVREQFANRNEFQRSEFERNASIPDRPRFCLYLTCLS